MREKNSFKTELILTEDGSHSIYVPELNEHYHSTFGAIQESNVVFIENGLKHIMKSKNDIRIFEMGFGTGLNAYLTWLNTSYLRCKIQYTALEAFPLDMQTVKSLNYVEILNPDADANNFNRMHEAAWGQTMALSDSFLIKKQKNFLLDFIPDNMFDLVYFDAFAPEIQPELWTAAVFDKIYKMMEPGGILVTYCCKGIVKRNMKAAGFEIEKLPGPPGKREVLRAFKAN